MMSSTRRAELPPTDSGTVRDVFATFPSGVAAIAAEIDGTREVLVASSFQVGISLEPPMVLFAVQNSSTTWPKLSKAARLGVSVLSTVHTPLVRQLAGKDRANRLDGVVTVAQPQGAVFLDRASAWLECELTHDYSAGDHRVIILTVLGSSVRAHHPLVFHRSAFHGLVPLT